MLNDGVPLFKNSSVRSDRTSLEEVAKGDPDAPGPFPGLSLLNHLRSLDDFSH
jgi:hypothetical protein